MVESSSAYPWPSPLRPLLCIVHLGLRRVVDEKITLDRRCNHSDDAH